MRSADEIKKGLECCKEDECFGERENCPYTADPSLCVGVMCADALALIQQLEVDKQQLEGMLTHMNQLRDAAAGRALKMEERVRQLEAERDALLKYITDSSWAACDICKHGIDGASVLDCKHIQEVGVPCFEWRGVQKEETK